jgi:hypothetical protein
MGLNIAVLSLRGRASVSSNISNKDLNLLIDFCESRFLVTIGT